MNPLFYEILLFEWIDNYLLLDAFSSPKWTCHLLWNDRHWGRQRKEGKNRETRLMKYYILFECLSLCPGWMQSVHFDIYYWDISLYWTPFACCLQVNIDFEPFKPINTSLYLCDNKFHTEALSALLADDNKFGFIVMDGNGALFGTLQGNTRDVLYKFNVDLPKKHGRGKWIRLFDSSSVSLMFADL